MNRLTTAVLSGIMAVGLGGCAIGSDPAPSEQTGHASSALTTNTWNPLLLGYSYDLVGRGLNGRALNGKVLDGHGVVGISYAGAKSGETALPPVTLDATVFHAALKGKDLTKRAFVGVVFQAQLDDGDALALRIDAIETETAKANDDVYYYTLSYPSDGDWKSFCGTDENGNALRAIPLAGRWDYRQGVQGGGSHVDDPTAFTFACEGYAIAKCVKMGYEPWQRVKWCRGGKACDTTLADLHQACTRTLRADYCGDGTSWTVDGTPVNIYDGFGIRSDTLAWPIEGEWTPAGARCVARERVASEGTPPCWSSLLAADCGDPAHFATGTLLMSEDVP